MPRMPITEVQAILQAEKADALGAPEASELSSQRSKAMAYYLGDESLDGDMPPPADRSKAVSSDVADTVEGLMPSLMEIFASGDDVVEFEPVGQEDEEAARQETDYINHVFWHRNHGFLTLYSFLKDGLLQKNGIVKVWWEDKEEEERETYEGLDEDAYALLISNPDIEIVEESVEEAPAEYATDATQEPVQAGLLGGALPMPPAPRMLHTVTVATKKSYGCAKVEPVPPEEFGISRRARSVHVGETDYCYHEVRKPQSELIGQGYDPLQVESLPTAGSDDTEEASARDTADDSDDLATASINKATRLIVVTEHYVKLDYEGNGKAGLYKIVTGSGTNQVLRKRKKTKGKDGKETEGKEYTNDIEPVDMMPFAAATPIIMTHRFTGRSVADLVMDIMRIKTALTRSGLDNIYLANNQRVEIAESHASDKTLDDLLTNRPGGIVRTKMPGGLNPIPNQDITGSIFPMLEYQDAVREWRTGVTRQGQGIDAKALANNQTATAAAQMFSMAQARMRLIARIFAETGIRDMFLLLHATIRKHGRNQQETIRLRGEWTDVDPRNWKTRNDMTVNVGISSGSKDQQMFFLMTLLGVQKEAIAVPQLGLVKPANIYSTLKKIVQIANLKSVEPYFTDPDEKDEQGNPVNMAPPAPDPKVMEAKAKAEAQAAIEQIKAATLKETEAIKLQAKQREKELDQQNQAFKEKVQAEADIIVERERTRSEERLAEQQRAFDAMQANLDRIHEMNLELVRQRGQAERQVAGDQAKAAAAEAKAAQSIPTGEPA